MKKLKTKIDSLGINNLLALVLIFSLFFLPALVFSDNPPPCDGMCDKVCSLCEELHSDNHETSPLTCEPCAGTGCDETDSGNHVGNPTCSTVCSGSGCHEKDPSNHEEPSATCSDPCECGWLGDNGHVTDPATINCDQECVCGTTGEIHDYDYHGNCTASGCYASGDPGCNSGENHSFVGGTCENCGYQAEGNNRCGQSPDGEHNYVAGKCEYCEGDPVCGSSPAGNHNFIAGMCEYCNIGEN